MAHPFDVDLRTVWRFRKAGQSDLDLALLDLLDAIEHSGKLTVAARAARISHRHAWNLIEKWSDFFGAPLVTIERGRGTQLSPLGAKLLWAGKRAQARLGPELENLAAELASSLNDAVTVSSATLRIHASHDFSLAKLRELAGKTRSVSIDLRYRGSAEALAALRRGACDVAGFHLTDGPLGRRAAIRYAEALGPAIHRLVSVATRVQGLIVPKGNPKLIGSVGDLAQPGVRFINRQRDKIKVLYWHRNGFCLWLKRLETDKFAWPSGGDSATQTVSLQEFEWLLEGFDLWRNQPHKTLHFTSVS